jgi:hypothetical protein
MKKPTPPAISLGKRGDALDLALWPELFVKGQLLEFLASPTPLPHEVKRSRARPYVLFYLRNIWRVSSTMLMVWELPSNLKDYASPSSLARLEKAIASKNWRESRANAAKYFARAMTYVVGARRCISSGDLLSALQCALYASEAFAKAHIEQSGYVDLLVSKQLTKAKKSRRRPVTKKDAEMVREFDRRILEDDGRSCYGKTKRVLDGIAKKNGLTREAARRRIERARAKLGQNKVGTEDIIVRD